MDRPRAGWRVPAALAVVLSVEAFVVLSALGLGSTPLLNGDHQDYHRLAVNVLDHGVFSRQGSFPYLPTVWRAPGYPSFIALAYLALGRSHMAVGLAQFVALWAGAVLLYRLALLFRSRAEAATAAFLFAVYPPLVFAGPNYSTEVVSTTITLALVLGLVLLWRQADPGWHWFLLLGLGLGVAAHVRPTWGPLAVVFALTFLAQPSTAWARRLGHAGLIASGFLAIVAPWMLRNSLLLGKPSGIGVGAGWSLHVSAQQYAGDVSYRLTYAEWMDILADQSRRWAKVAAAVPDSSDTAVLARREDLLDGQYARDAAVKFRGIAPARYIPSAVVRLYYLWSTADLSPWTVGPFHRFVQCAHIALAGLVAGGVFVARKDLVRHWPLWIMAVYLTTLHLVFHEEPRYTMQARPFLLIYAGVALVTAWELWCATRPEVLPDHQRTGSDD